ncbi:MAG: hypothetical protein HPY80_01085 [Bacteroidales bacterium]|jgi:hypothetical protein|nr:hypothetical protein [Bacteroidales bacterium]NPV35242.1 hypothetical protein [Bacteroidales bacterium]
MKFVESRGAREAWGGWVVLLGGLMALTAGLVATLTQASIAIEQGKVYSDLVLPIIISLFVSGFCIYLFVSMRLEIIIDERGISFSFRPFIKYRQYSWDAISYAWVRKYRAIGEYGGWGYRGVGRRRRAFTLGEKYGIQIITTDGRDILLGTARHEIAASALRSFGKGTPPSTPWPPKRWQSFLNWIKRNSSHNE